jgi:hypothetical protein
MFAVHPANNTSHACSPIALSSHVQLNNSQISSNNYSPLTSSSRTQLRRIPIDPVLIPIPDAANKDLSVLQKPMAIHLSRRLLVLGAVKGSNEWKLRYSWALVSGKLFLT